MRCPSIQVLRLSSMQEKRSTENTQIKALLRSTQMNRTSIISIACHILVECVEAEWVPDGDRLVVDATVAMRTGNHRRSFFSHLCLTLKQFRCFSSTNTQVVESLRVVNSRLTGFKVGKHTSKPRVSRQELFKYHLDKKQDFIDLNIIASDRLYIKTR